MTPRILIGAAARGRPDQYRKEIAAVLPDSLRDAVLEFDLSDSDERWGDALQRADAVILTSRGIGASAVRSAPRLRFVQKLGVDVERVALEVCRERSVVVSVLPDAGHVAVAEHTLALAMAVARRLIPTHLAMVRGENPAGLVPVKTTQNVRHVNWLRCPEDDFRLLADQTLGLVGFGAIAREVAHRSRPMFGRIVYTKRNRLPAEVERQWGVEYLPLDRLLADADVVSLHATQPDGVKPLLGADELAAMKRGAFLINTARGNQIDQAALVRALQARLGGAALDVFETEPVFDRELLDLPNVVLTPHTANLMPTGRRFDQALANIEAVWAGRMPKGAV